MKKTKTKTRLKKDVKTLIVDFDAESGEFLRFRNLMSFQKSISYLMLADFFMDLEAESKNIKDAFVALANV